MLSPAAVPAPLLRATDAAVVKPLFEEKLSAAWKRPVAIADFVVPRVFARGGGRLLVQYRFSIVGRSFTFWGRVGFEGTGRDDRRSFEVPELGLVVPIFPFDPELAALARFFEPSESAGLLADLRDPLDLTAAARLGDVRLLGYRPGRRAVLRCGLVGSRREKAVVAKVMSLRKAARLGQVLGELARRGLQGTDAGAIRVPRVIAEAKCGILWLEERPEPSLHDLVGAPEFVTGCRRAARALHRLRALPMPDLPRWGVETELAQLRKVVGETCEVLPELASPLDEATRRVEALSPGPPLAVGTVHRDFHDKQLLTGADGTTLIDVDTLAVGDAVQDAGNFLAHLALRALQEPGAAGLIAEGRRAFLAEYGGLSEARCRFWEGASLVRLACLYSLRPRWRALAVPLLEASRKRLRVSGGVHA